MLAECGLPPKAWCDVVGALELGLNTAVLVRGYTACRILLIQSANGNGNKIPLNGILFNGISFPLVSIKAYLPASINCH